jgi:hypothetical protein
MTKGADKITIKETRSETEFRGEASYKGKTCKMIFKSYTVKQREDACKQAWNKCKDDSDSWCLEDEYYGILEKYNDEIEKDFENCLIRNNFPLEAFGDGDDEGDYAYKKAAKSVKPMMLKKPLLKFF